MDPRLQVRPTPTAGNGVFALAPIPHNSLLLTTQTPRLNVIYRPYRREACGYCFKYNLGRHWKIKGSETGFVFCSEECKVRWEEEVGVLGQRAFMAVEAFTRGKKDVSMAEKEELEDEVPLTVAEVQKAWTATEGVARGILKQRKLKPGAALRLINSLPVDIDALMFILAGLLCLQKSVVVHHVDKSCEATSLDSLYEAPVPYCLKSQLEAHVNSYLQLLAILPSELLSVNTPENVRRIAGVAYCNAFGTRSIDHATDVDASNDEEPGSELLGWALYPEASLFNHSCAPNVRKVRDGRRWKFWSNRDVAEGEEMCITYLGGDERNMNVDERQEKLKLGWEFGCACQRCSREMTGKLENGNIL